MSRYIQTNPFSAIYDYINAFYLANYDSIIALAETNFVPEPTAKTREIAFSKAIKQGTDPVYFMGFVNIHLMNDRYGTSNLKKTNQLRYADNTDEVTISNLKSLNAKEISSAEAFKEIQIDPRDNYHIAITLKQFRTDNLGLGDATITFRYNTIPNVISKEQAVKRPETTGMLWNDPAMVLATREFFDAAKPTLDAWNGNIQPEDCTLRTLYQTV